MTFQNLKEKTGWSLKRFSDYFNVPYRTVQNWASGVSQCPEYLLQLFVYKMQQEGALSGTEPKLYAYTEPAKRIKVEVDGSIETYAKAFLAIYNNVKNDRDLYKVYNDYDNGIYLVLHPDFEGEAVSFLEQFGEVVSVSDVQVVRAEVTSIEYPEYDDVEFLEPEE